jgi:hypothetical protein
MMRDRFPGLLINTKIASLQEWGRERDEWNRCFRDDNGRIRRNQNNALGRFMCAKDLLYPPLLEKAQHILLRVRHSDTTMYSTTLQEFLNAQSLVMENPYDEAICDAGIMILRRLGIIAKRMRLLRIFVEAGAGPDFILPEGEELERALAVAEVHSA